MNHSKARWRLKNLLRMALSTQLCLSLLIVHSPVARAKIHMPPGFPPAMIDPATGESTDGSLYKINRDGKILYGSESMSFDQLAPGEHDRLFHLLRTTRDEKLDDLAEQLIDADQDVNAYTGECGTISKLFGCNDEENAKKLEAAKKLREQKLGEANLAIQEYYNSHPNDVEELNTFNAYRFSGINDSWSNNGSDIDPEFDKKYPFCKNYPSMGVTNYKDYMGENHDSDLLFSTCIDDKTPFAVTVGNLVDNYAEIEAFNYQKGVDLFNRELANASMQKILETRSAYMSTSPAAFSNSEKETLAELNTCLGENAKDGVGAESSQAVQEAMSDLTAKEDALSEEERKNYKHAYNQSNLKNAVISAALFNLHNVEMANISGERAKAEEELRTCRGRSSKTRARIRGQAKECYAAHKEVVEMLDEKESNQELLTMGPISLLYKKDPTLFTEINHGSLLDWNNYKPAPSELANKIAGKPKSGELVNLVQEAIKANPGSPVSAAEAALSGHMELFEEATSAIEQDRAIQNLSANTTKNHINDLTESALKLCQGDIEQLHHFPDLYADVMQNIATSGDPNSKERIMQMQGAYCYLLRKDPPNQKSGFTLLQGLGIGLAVIGTVAQIIPVAGTAVGTGLILIGGALTTIDAARKLNDRLNEQASQNAVLAAGWSDYKAKLDARSSVADGWADLGIETAFIAVDVVTTPLVAVKVASAMKRTKGVADVTEESADAIIRTAAAHGDEAAQEAMRLKGAATAAGEIKSVPAATLGEDISGEMIRAQRAAAAKASELDPMSQAIIDAAAKGDDMAEDLMTTPHIASKVDPVPETLRGADDALSTRVADQVTPTQIDEVKVSENLSVVRNQSTEVGPIKSTVAEVLPVETKNIPVIKGQPTDVTTLNPVKASQAEGIAKVSPEEAATKGLALRAETSKSGTALAPVDEAKRIAPVNESKRVTPVQSNEPLLLTKPKISQVDEAADIVANIRSDIARRPATNAKIDLAAKLSKNSDGLIDDFMQALSDVPTSTRNRLLEHIDKGHFAPEELSKIMDEAVASLRKACQ